ncbi:hypothetical protein KA119_00105 [Candidatus Gracilibacteria bacterium]|nr:hypothetical protein [Candidatus Gracilibacteria bacterium]
MRKFGGPKKPEEDFNDPNEVTQPEIDETFEQTVAQQIAENQRMILYYLQMLKTDKDHKNKPYHERYLKIHRDNLAKLERKRNTN